VASLKLEDPETERLWLMSCLCLPDLRLGREGLGAAGAVYGLVGSVCFTRLEDGATGALAS
jgi:hypothetical protein